MRKQNSNAGRGVVGAVIVAGCFICAFVQYSLLPLDAHLVDVHSQVLPTKHEFVKEKPATVTRPLAKDQLQLETLRNTTSTKIPHYYTVFSTSCSPQQDWESFVFFFHAMQVKQPGSVTRILSGCKDFEEKEQRDFYERYIEPMGDFHVHFTPSYSKLHLAEGAPYKYSNKPYGLLHWFEHALGLNSTSNILAASGELLDGIVILMDPDMILLRPLQHDFTDEHVLWVENEPVSKIVRHGHPIAQHDGYLTNQWMSLPLNFTKPFDRDGPLHWNSGPPYMATVKDFYQLTLKWTSWLPKVLQVYPKLFAEMYALIFAGVELNLPFTFIRSIVVSDPTAGSKREGWPFIDALTDEELCNVPESAPMPIALHYCSRYMIGKNFFSKYRLKKNIMDCDKALILPPAIDVYPRYSFTVNVPLANGRDRDTYQEEHTPFSSVQEARRQAFMVCAMTAKVNEALVYIKERACNGTANFNKTYSVYDDPSNTR
ncbi:hypothetical protein MPSEU_000506800 [Mayamaea pseudoterrestris]|nr:hypothetical protein MPSEU_000506800 [Mayamaea pseudoterrestris]